MSVRRIEDAVALVGDCSIEDAELLLGLLLDDPAAPIDLQGCGRVHTAVVQVLLAARRPVRGVPGNSLVADWILPQLLDASGESTFTLPHGRSS